LGVGVFLDSVVCIDRGSLWDSVVCIDRGSFWDSSRFQGSLLVVSIDRGSLSALDWGDA